MFNDEYIIVTVFHEGIARYFPDFISSINQQSFKDFSLIVFNDSKIDVSSKYLNNIGSLNLDVINLPSNLTLLENRVWVLNFLKNTESKIIHFVDADDTLELDYIELSNNYLNNCDLLVHDFNMVDENLRTIKTKYWSDRISDNTPVSIEFLLKKNIIGFGNTSLHSSIIRNIEIKISSVVSIPDWFIFYQIVKSQNPKILFTNRALFNYRQHNNLGSLMSISKEGLKKKVWHTINHYEGLSEIGILNDSTICSQLKDLYLNLNSKIFEIYTQHISDINIFWWEDISKLVELYGNKNK